MLEKCNGCGRKLSNFGNYLQNLSEFEENLTKIWILSPGGSQLSIPRFNSEENRAGIPGRPPTYTVHVIGKVPIVNDGVEGSVERLLLEASEGLGVDIPKVTVHDESG